VTAVPAAGPLAEGAEVKAVAALEKDPAALGKGVLHNQFVVYDSAQYILRYMVHVDFLLQNPAKLAPAPRGAHSADGADSDVELVRPHCLASATVLRRGSMRLRS
jgi:hypothetical protein